MGENLTMPEPYNDGAAEKLRRLIETIDIANILTEPLARSIDALLRVTAEDIGAEAASVLIRDGDQGDLRFLSATGKVSQQLSEIKIPAGKGIAGFVMSSGQPIAVANVEEESAFYREVDKATGYSTEMILATPLRHSGEIIGVLEYINRAENVSKEPFSPEEMDRAGRFAEAIASLVNAYESAKLFRDMDSRFIESSGDFPVDEIRNWPAELRTGAEHREMMDLAVMLRELAGRGEAERQLCRSLLEALLRFTESSTGTSFLSFDDQN